MKIISVAYNNVTEREVINLTEEDKPIFTLLPDSSLLRENRPFFVPRFSNEILPQTHIVVRINKLGRNISEKFAHRYYDEIALGVDFTAQDILEKAQKDGTPWSQSKVFDGSTVVSPFISLDSLDNKEVNFELYKDKELIQKGNLTNLFFSIDQLIEYISQFITLKIGDLIFTGAPICQHKVCINNRITGFLNHSKVCDFIVK